MCCDFCYNLRGFLVDKDQLSGFPLHLCWCHGRAPAGFLLLVGGVGAVGLGGSLKWGKSGPPSTAGWRDEETTGLLPSTTEWRSMRCQMCKCPTCHQPRSPAWPVELLITTLNYTPGQAVLMSFFFSMTWTSKAGRTSLTRWVVFSPSSSPPFSM